MFKNLLEKIKIVEGERRGANRQSPVDAPFAIRSRIGRKSDLLIGLSGIAVLVAAWWLLTKFNVIGEFFLPKPQSIVQGVIDLHYDQGVLLPAIKRSFLRVTEALGLTILIGVPIGVLMGTFSPIDALLRKVINGGKSVPTSGLLGLVVLWFGSNERGKVVFLFLGAIFFMVILVKNAVQSVNEDYVRVAIDLGANRWQTVLRVLLPGALPQIWDAFAVCNGIMWTYIVLVEYLNANMSNLENLGLGVLLRVSTITNRPAQVFAVLIIIAVISSMTDFLFRVVRKFWLNW